MGRVAGDALRALFREIPSPVAVVTVDISGQAAGLTVDSFVPLSLEPPLVGLALRRHAALHELVREAGAFAVSVLASGQEHLAQHFARGVPPIALWTGIETSRGELGAPLLDGALGWLECRLSSEVDAGDHTFFVGAVEVARRGPGPDALVHLRREYS
jgi:flavin reductase (DIM6/NTAB) family NADH-FMN oxidoreductase RutF